MTKIPTLARSLVLACVLAGSGHAASTGTDRPASMEGRADASAEQISDTASFLEEIDLAVAMARNGEYGHLRKSELEGISKARLEIRALLEGHERATDLEPGERVALFNAQELITHTLRSHDKHRKVCKRAPTTGSRLTKVECMTIAQREARNKASRDLVRTIQGNVCNPAELGNGTVRDCGLPGF